MLPTRSQVLPVEIMDGYIFFEDCRVRSRPLTQVQAIDCNKNDHTITVYARDIFEKPHKVSSHGFPSLKEYKWHTISGRDGREIHINLQSVLAFSFDQGTDLYPATTEELEIAELLEQKPRSPRSILSDTFKRTPLDHKISRNALNLDFDKNDIANLEQEVNLLEFAFFS